MLSSRNSVARCPHDVYPEVRRHRAGLGCNRYRNSRRLWGLRGRDCNFCGRQCSSIPLGSLLIREPPCFCLVLSPSQGDPAAGQCAVKFFAASSQSPWQPEGGGFCFLCSGICSTLRNTCLCRGISGRTRCKGKKDPNP